jgi:hypothetical protein
MEEKNLKKLRKSNRLKDFVKRMNGVWTHEQWEEFCAMLEYEGYTPIDFDQVGLLLEDEKVKFFTRDKF